MNRGVHGGVRGDVNAGVKAAHRLVGARKLDRDAVERGARLCAQRLELSNLNVRVRVIIKAGARARARVSVGRYMPPYAT